MNASPFLQFFIRHKTAANLLMILMLVVGLISLERLNRQFFPSFEVELVVVNVGWSGATAEDIDANIIQPLEPELRTISNVKKSSQTVTRALLPSRWNLNSARI